MQKQRLTEPLSVSSLVSERELHEGQIILQAMSYEVAPALAQAAIDTGIARLRVDARPVERYMIHQ